MSGNPIPQLVNISHALQSSFVQQLRTETKEFSETTQLSQEQQRKIDTYISSLERAFLAFTHDNEHIERRDAEVTPADVQLYNGLKTMYADYLTQLTKLRQRSVTDEKQERNEQLLVYISDELPYKQVTERKAYVEGLLKSQETHISKSPKLLSGIANLAILDSTVGENLQSYAAFLKRAGYDDSEIATCIPQVNGKHESKVEAPSPVVKPSVEKPRAIPAVPEEPKKKISFSKYLKKGDVNDQGKRGPEYDASERPLKRSHSVEESNPNIISILKREASKKKRNPIRFVADDKLLTVYGDDIAPDGLVVSPQKLKKILKPFKDGEPREVTHPTWKNQKVLEISIPKPTDESDIVDIKGGPITSETRISVGYRLNFTSFNKNLNKPPLEPTEPDEKDQNLMKKPLIVRAFGKNCLLLQKDRGGLPYKRVPEVSMNDYPIRPNSN